MEIKNIALMGAGAVGAYFIYCLNDKLGDEFVVVASGARKEKFVSEGITINGKVYKLNVKTPDEIAAGSKTTNINPVDVLIIATKYDGLKQSMEDIKKIIGPTTIILPVLNGIDSEEVLAAEIGEERIVNSFMRIVSHRGDDGIVFDPGVTPGVFFGEKDGTDTDRLAALRDFFDKYDTHYVCSDNIISDQWNKFALNIANNLIQAVFGVGYGAYFDSEHVHFLQEKITQEVTDVAKAYGVTIEGLPTPREVTHDAARFSTLQDLDAHRHTEIDMFLGVLVEKAAAKGLEVPYAEYTYHAIKTREEINDGKLIYKK